MCPGEIEKRNGLTDEVIQWKLIIKIKRLEELALARFQKPYHR